jgi:hypothetical protein
LLPGSINPSKEIFLFYLTLFKSEIIFLLGLFSMVSRIRGL